MLRAFTTVAEALANRRWRRLIYVGPLVLLPVAFAALAAGAGWLLVAVVAVGTAVDGLLRLAPIGRGRLLRVIRDRSAQASTVRIALMAAALAWLGDARAAALVTGAGLAVTVLCRVIAGGLQEHAARAGWAGAPHASAAKGIQSWLARIGVAARYNRGLVLTEIAVIVALALALADASAGWVAAVAVAAWLPSVELPAMAAWRWAYSRRHRELAAARDAPHARVAVYFAEPVPRAYQLQQWLPVLDDLHRDLGTLLVFRNRSAFDLFGQLTTLPRYLAPSLDDLTAMYTAGNYAVVLYVNNGWRNFQSLAWPRSLHIHINHGESDKTSLVTHQSRAYDRVLVAGSAAVRRMQTGLLEVDQSSVVVVGRPQLDYVDVDVTAADGVPVLVYAPTWEGENDANNFSSVDVGGPDIVRALLDVSGARVLYKPHPRTPASPDPRARAAHHAICRLLEEAAAPNPAAGHGVWTGDILPLLARADVLVADVSSVAVDHLYLRPEGRLVLMDRGRDGGDVVAADIPIARAATVVRADRLDGLSATVAGILVTVGSTSDARAQVRREYFGDFAVGQSAAQFQAVVRDLVAHRDDMVRAGQVAAAVTVEDSA
ncbi:MAG: CDP-glycerol glycerophosphotransferase family protein [Jiangellaceae bacterium]